MNFVSFAFVGLFAVAYLWRLTAGREGRETPYLVGLLVASLLFYGWHEPPYLLLLLLSAGVDARCDRDRDGRGFRLAPL